MSNQMKASLKFFAISIIYFTLNSCTSIHNDYLKILQGTWSIQRLEYYDEIENEIFDLKKDQRFYSIGFERNNHVWFTRVENKEDKILRASYSIFKENDTLKLQIEGSNNKKIDGVYDLYLDTIVETQLHYKVQISLDKEETFLSAARMKSKKPKPQRK